MSPIIKAHLDEIKEARKKEMEKKPQR